MAKSQRSTQAALTNQVLSRTRQAGAKTAPAATSSGERAQVCSAWADSSTVVSKATTMRRRFEPSVGAATRQRAQLEGPGVNMGSPSGRLTSRMRRIGRGIHWSKKHSRLFLASIS